MATYNSSSSQYDPNNYAIILPMEQSFDPIKSKQWMEENWHYSIAVSLIYVIAIFAGQKFMESRKPFSLKWPLFWWNFGLAVFSIIGFFRMTPEWWWSITSHSFEYSICTTSFVHDVTGFWTEKFVMSKIFELGDTVFIILRKRQLIFLHWYHHITVLIYTWHAYKDHTASGRWFVWMNYAVHSFMYSYYAIRALNIRVPKFCAMIITLLQLLQMAAGIYIGITVYSIKTYGGKFCQQKWSNLYFAFTIYFSYFLLFCNFFYHTYLKKKSGHHHGKHKKKTEDIIGGATTAAVGEEKKTDVSMKKKKKD